MSKNSDDYSILDTVRDHCGAEVADLLQQKFGGIRLRIPSPQTISPQSRLVRELGLDNAKAVCKAVSVGKGSYDDLIPMGDKSMRLISREKVENLLRQGSSVRETAIAVGVHERTVLRIRARVKQAEIPDVKLMLSRGRSVEDVAKYTILSRKQICQLRAQLEAEDKCATE